MWYRNRNSQSQALPCLVGKQIMGRSSGPSIAPDPVSTTMPALEPTHVPVKPTNRLNKSVSGERNQGRSKARSPKQFVEVSVKNIPYPSCESDLNAGADPALYFLHYLRRRPVRIDKRTPLHRHPVSTNMPVLRPKCVQLLPGQMSSLAERPPGCRGASSQEPSCESDLKNNAHPSLPRLSSFASQSVRMDKRVPLHVRPAVVTTNMPVLGPTHVPVKPPPGPQKKGGVVVAQTLIHFQGSFDNKDVKVKRAQTPICIPPLVTRFSFADKKPYTTTRGQFTSSFGAYKASSR